MINYNSSSPSVWITGSGVVTCCGETPEDFWLNLIEGKSGILNGLGQIKNSKYEQNKALKLCLEAANQAMTAAGWSQLNPEDGLLLATTTGQILSWDRDLIRYLNDKISANDFQKSFSKQPLGNFIEILAKNLGHTRHKFLITSSCTAATQALAMGVLWLKLKKVKRCLVGGVEVLCDLTTEGFKSLQLLSNTYSKPFDQNRNGINLSEGAGFICLEMADFEKKPLAKISGLGMSSDGHHMTSPHPLGLGSQKAIRLALRSAGLNSSDIDWIHAHGTGSYYNDLSEGIAINSVFGENSPFTTSTKSGHGHTLGASGLLETVLCLQALKNQTILKTLGLSSPDSKIPIRHPKNNQPFKIKHILKNTLGFGGANAAIVLSQPEAHHE